MKINSKILQQMETIKKKTYKEKEQRTESGVTETRHIKCC